MNYCEYFADLARDAFPECAVYSNVDPTREWNGTPTLEFNEPDEPTTRGFLSGFALTTRTLYMIARAATTTGAEELASRLYDFAVSRASALQANGAVHAWSIANAGTSSDVRGIVEGESFYGYLEITLTERVKNGC